MSRMKVVTLCGSTKFREEFEEVMARETLKGNIVISVGLFGHDPQWNFEMSGPVKKMLDRMHFQKIDMADEIYVVNPRGYVGLSTCDEIHYAMAKGKRIRWYTRPVEWIWDDDGERIQEGCYPLEYGEEQPND